MEKNPNFHLHYRYIIVLLLSFTVFLMTNNWTESEGFTQFLSNAATMTSLLLGVVAIFYSFISNNSMSNSLGSISEISKDVNKVGSQIAEYHETSGDLIEAGRKGTQAFEDVSKEIKENLDSLHCALKAMDEKSIRMRDFMEQIPSQIIQLEERFSKFADNLSKEKEITTVNREIQSWDLEMFVSRSGGLENLITYACLLHAASNHILHVDKTCEAMEIGSPLVLNAFIRCLDSVDILTLESIPKVNLAYKVTIDSKHILDEYEELMSFDFKESYSPEQAQKFMAALEKLKSYVASLDSHEQ